MNSVRKHLNLQGLPSIFNGLRSGYSTFNVHLRWFCWRYLFGISMSSLPSAMRPLSSPMTSMPSRFWGRNPVENGVASRLMVKGPSTIWKTCLRWRKTCISSSSWVNQNQPKKHICKTDVFSDENSYFCTHLWCWMVYVQATCWDGVQNTSLQEVPRNHTVSYCLVGSDAVALDQLLEVSFLKQYSKIIHLLWMRIWDERWKGIIRSRFQSRLFA